MANRRMETDESYGQKVVFFLFFIFIAGKIMSLGYYEMEQPTQRSDCRKFPDERLKIHHESVMPCPELGVAEGL